MIKIIIINGVGGSGKDEFVKQFQNHFFGKVYNFSTVYTVKKAAKILGWKGTKTEKDRKFLSDLKDLYVQYNDGPFNEIKKLIDIIRLNKYKKNNTFFIFIHCREPEEIDKFKKHYGENCHTLLIKRTNTKIDSNHADKNVENYNYDKIIHNNGSIEDLSLKSYQYGKELCLNILQN